MFVMSQVYDGSHSWWSEDDGCEPVNVYSVTKREAEVLIQVGINSCFWPNTNNPKPLWEQGMHLMASLLQLYSQITESKGLSPKFTDTQSYDCLLDYKRVPRIC